NKQPEDDEDYCARVAAALEDYHDKADSGSFLDNLLNPVGWTRPADYIKPEVDKALDAFLTKKIGEIAGAEIELHNRLFAEWQHEIDEEQAKVDKETAKRQDQLIKLVAEEEERQALLEAY